MSGTDKAKGKDRDLPALPSGSLPDNVTGYLNQWREAIQRLMGKRGDAGRAAVLWDDLVDAGVADGRRNITISGAGGATTVVVDSGGGGGGSTYTPDLTKPPTPTGLTASAGFSNVIVQWNVATYTAGHGHKQTNIYATKQDKDDVTLKAFADAVRVDSAQGALTIQALPTDTGIKWRIWIKYESADGVESDPAGGPNGFVITSGVIGNADIGDLVVEAKNLAEGAVLSSKQRLQSIGLPLNNDPWFSDPSYWHLVYGSASYLSGISDGPAGESTAAENADGSNAALRTVELIDVDPEAAYVIECYARQKPGSTGGLHYLCVMWFDAAGNMLVSNEAQPGGAGSPSGWYNEYYSYFGAYGEAPPSDWVKYSAKFGYGQGRIVPSNAKFMRPLAILNNSSDVGVNHQVSGLKITKIVSEQVVSDGSIDLGSAAVKADGSFGALAVGYTVTQYLVATSGILNNLIVDDAQISNLSAAKLTAGDGTIGGNLKSTNYSAGSLGWIVRPDGFSEFSNAVVRGTIYASAGAIGGSYIGATYMQSTTWDSNYGWQLTSDGGAKFISESGSRIFDISASGSDPVLLIGDSISISADGSSSYSGSLSAATGTFAGELQAATGTFIGEVAAGSLDVKKLSGESQLNSDPGVYTYTTPADGKFSSVRFTLFGAGGGGGGARYSGNIQIGYKAGGGGGQGGVYILTLENVPASTVFTITVGSSGVAGGYPGGNGGNGGGTTISWSDGSFTAGGGYGGDGASTTAGGSPGAGGTGGGSGFTGASGSFATGGGDSAINHGGNGGFGSGGAGFPGNNGTALVEAFNPNGVILREDWDTLITHLNQRFGSYSWP